MKRTFAVIGFSFMLGLVACNFVFGNKSAYLTLAASALSAIFLSVKKLRAKKELCCLFVSLFISSAVFTAVNSYVYTPTVRYADTRCDIEATVLDTPVISSGGNYGYLIRTNTINGEEASIKMRLYVPYDISAEPYDEISFTSYPFIIGSNDKGMYLHFRSRGTYLGVYTKYDVGIHTPDKKPLISIFPILKAQSIKIIKHFLGEKYAGFSIGILFGDKILIDADAKESFQRVGMTHIMAVSGLHMSVWVYGLYRLLKRAHVTEGRASFISILFSFCVVCFSSFSVSVIRAMIMTCVYLSAGLFKRRSDALNSLGLAIFLMCIVNPFVVCDVSFLLSVFSTLGIILTSSELSKLKDTVKHTKIKSVLDIMPIKYLTESIALSVSASAFTYPIAVGIFGGISLVSPIVNLLVIPALTPCLLLSGVMTMLPSLTLLMKIVRHFLILFENYVFFFVEIFARLRFSYIQTENLVFCVVIPIIAATVLCVLYSIKEKKFNVTAFSAAASVSVIAIFYYL